MLDSLTTNASADQLTMTWQDGGQTTLPAAFLRRQAKDAWSIREKIDHGDITVKEGITITGLYEIGGGGVNIHFSDGHDRAIYPFPYLRELSDGFDK